MNILFITQVYPNKNNPGIAIFLKQLVDSFKNNGNNIKVLKPTNTRNFKNQTLEYEETYCTKFLSLGDKYFRHFTLISFIFSSILFLFNIKKKPDFIYGKFLYFSGGACFFIKKFFGIPYFIDIGESNIFYYKNKLDIFLMRKFLSYADGIICVSEKLKTQIMSCNVDESKVLLAKNTVDNSKFKVLNPSYARKVLGLNNDDFIIVFVGHFNYRKGPDRLLKAVETGNFPKHVKIVFLGTGDIDLESDRILFKGEVATENLIFWLNASNLFALPTIAEGNSNAINEALSLGIPIICSNIKELHEQIPAEYATYFDPLDIKSIQIAISKNLSKSILRLTPVIFKINRNTMIADWIAKKLT